MKNNQPVTQREVDYDESEVFISRTDLKGIITSVNETFCRIAGYAEDELVGVNHNIVRHPDMPEWAFQSLWDTLKAGRPWRGIVKNRCKNGDHYWVRATVTPILRDGQAVGYLSLRKKPSRQQVAAAEALYRAHPKSAPAHRFSLRQWFSNQRLQVKIQSLIQPLLSALLLIGAYAIYQQGKTSIIHDAIAKGDAIAMQVIDSANTLMATGMISNPDNRRAMIRELVEKQHLSSLRLVRTAQVVKQFGPGLPEERLDDPLVKATIAASVRAGKSIPYARMQVADGRPTLRVITPYIVGDPALSAKCQNCHTVALGTANGASDLSIDLSGKFGELDKMIATIAAGQVALQFFLFFAIGWLLKRFVVQPIKAVRGHLEEIADGDFSRPADIDRHDEIGGLLNATQSNKVLMGAVIDQIRTTANAVARSAEYLAHSAGEAGAAANAQSDASRSMAASIEEISASIDHIAENAGEVREISERSADSARTGGATIGEVIADMSSISNEVLAAAGAVKRLGERSAEINGIVNTIRAIADQTNLLALNAAIEAARAGEQGRGFAVVADEVRKLSEQTAKSTATIGEVVKGIGNGTEDAIRMIEAAIEKVHHGEQLAATAGGTIMEMSRGAGKVLVGVSDISASIREQSVTSSGIAAQVERVAQMAEDNKTSIMRVDDSAKTLKSLFVNLKKLTDSFKL